MIAASRGLGFLGGSGSRAFAPSGPTTSEGLSVEKAISSSGWRASARVQDASERLNGSFGASTFAPGLRLLVGLTSTLDMTAFFEGEPRDTARKPFYRLGALAAARRRLKG